jgi:uncharacterized protein (DUF488 family)
MGVDFSRKKDIISIIKGQYTQRGIFMVLTTLGYEGLDVEDFFSILDHNKVQTIVDIRELPLSRKSGFSKTALSKNAESYGFRYIHLRDLGAPRKIRHEYRDDEDWDRFSKKYLEHLKLQSTEIELLTEMVQKENCCLICFEADHSHCHRNYVADAVLAQTDGGLKINHLEA